MKITRNYLKKIILEEVKDNLRQTAGVIIIDRNPTLAEPHILVLRAYRNWDFPKGGFDEKYDTDLIDTAIRETREETTLEEGLDYKLSLNKKVRSNLYGGTGGKKIATYYLADRIGKKDPFLAVNPEIGKPEHDEWRWVPISEVIDPESNLGMGTQRMIPVIKFLMDESSLTVNERVIKRIIREYIQETLHEGIEFRTLDSPLKYNRASNIKRIALCDTSVTEPNPSRDAYFNEYQEMERYGVSGRRLKKPRKGQLVPGVSDTCVIGFLDYHRQAKTRDGNDMWYIDYMKTRGDKGRQGTASKLIDEFYNTVVKPGDQVHFGKMMRKEIGHLKDKMVNKYPEINTIGAKNY